MIPQGKRENPTEKSPMEYWVDFQDEFYAGCDFLPDQAQTCLTRTYAATCAEHWDDQESIYHASSRWPQQRAVPHRKGLRPQDVQASRDTQTDETVLLRVFPHRQQGDTHQHPHFSCDDCGLLTCLPNEIKNVDAIEGPWAKAIQQASIQLHGQCPDCL